MSFVEFVRIFLPLAHVANFHWIHRTLLTYLNKGQVRKLEKYIVPPLEILFHSHILFNLAGGPVRHIKFKSPGRKLGDPVDLEGLLEEI